MASWGLLAPFPSPPSLFLFEKASKITIEIGAFWPLKVAFGMPSVAGPIIGPRFISLARPKQKTLI